MYLGESVSIYLSLDPNLLLKILILIQEARSLLGSVKYYGAIYKRC